MTLLEQSNVEQIAERRVFGLALHVVARIRAALELKIGCMSVELCRAKTIVARFGSPDFTSSSSSAPAPPRSSSALPSIGAGDSFARAPFGVKAPS